MIKPVSLSQSQNTHPYVLMQIVEKKKQLLLGIYFWILMHAESKGQN